MSRAAAAETRRAAPKPQGSAYVVLDDADRIVQVGPALHDVLGAWIGQVLWDRLPNAVAVYGPCLHRARSTQQVAEEVVYYASRVKRLIATPARDGLRVHVEVLAELDVTTLGTLAESLRQAERVLAARERAQHDPRAHVFPQAPL